LWKDNNAFVVKYCSGMLRQFRFSEDFEKMFWEYIQKLQMENSIESRNCILDVYNSFRIYNVLNKTGKCNAFEKKDFELVSSVFQNSTVENYFNLATTLPTIFFYDKDIAVREIKYFLHNCNERHLD